MLSEADTRTIDTCRQVLRDQATASKRASRMETGGGVYAYGMFAAYCTAADHALAAVLTHAATYLDDVHAEASLRQAGPRPLEP